MVRVTAATPALLPVVRGLFEEYARSLGFDLGFQRFAAELADLPGAYAPPGGALYLAGPADDPAGCVALRPFAPGTAEMKRLYVRPAHRGQGLGRRLAVAVVDEARRLGYGRMVLDTIDTMTGAMALYASLGFVRIPAYRANPIPGATFFALVLDPA